MKNILTLVCLAGMLSSCISVSNNPPDPTPSATEITALTVATEYRSNADPTEFYICGNQDANLELSLSYRGSFSSYSVILLGENNPGVQLVKGPFSLQADNGESINTVAQTVTLSAKDIKPTKSSMATQAVTVTPIPPQSGGGLGVGAFRVKVQMAIGNRVYTRTTNAVVRVLGDSNSRCAITPPIPVAVNSVNLAAPFQNDSNGKEFYICGNRDENVAVTIGYSGAFTSYRLVFTGELNPSQQLVKGPFTFDATNGDTSTSITREVTIGVDEVKPTRGGVYPQAVIVTPIPPQSGSDVGLGGFRVRVEMTDATGTVSKTSSAIIRVLGNSNSRCLPPVPPALTSVSFATRFVDNARGEFYLCGNRDESTSVSFVYNGTFSTYKLVFSGENNPQTMLVKGPFAFDATNGDTTTEITRIVVVSQNDIHPLAVGVRPQSVPITPSVIAPPPTNTLLGGAMKVRVEMTGSNGVVQMSAPGRILILKDTSPNC